MKFPIWNVNKFMRTGIIECAVLTAPAAREGSEENWLAIANSEMSKRCNPWQHLQLSDTDYATMPGFSSSHSGPVMVGFTGHRRVENEGKIAQALQEVIAALQREIGGEIIGRSSIASGGDTLFAEACRASKVKWIAQLPFPEAEFKKDFSESDWKRAKELLDYAERIEVLSDTVERPGGYLHCGLSTVEGADLMIALWDGKASRGLGGTAQIVAHARFVQKPLLLISSETLEVIREQFT